MDLADPIRRFLDQSPERPPSGDDYSAGMRHMLDAPPDRRPVERLPGLKESVPEPSAFLNHIFKPIERSAVEHDPVLGEELHKILADSASEAAALRTRESVRPTGGRQEGIGTDIVTKAPGALISAPFRAIGQGAEDMRRVAYGELDPMSPEGIGEGMNAAMQAVGRGHRAKRSAAF